MFSTIECAENSKEKMLQCGLLLRNFAGDLAGTLDRKHQTLVNGKLQESNIESEKLYKSCF